LESLGMEKCWYLWTFVPIILLTFGIFCCYLIHFSPFGMLYQIWQPWYQLCRAISEGHARDIFCRPLSPTYTRVHLRNLCWLLFYVVRITRHMPMSVDPHHAPQVNVLTSPFVYVYILFTWLLVIFLRPQKAL
jgi:hypothetical protein